MAMKRSGVCAAVVLGLWCGLLGTQAKAGRLEHGNAGASGPLSTSCGGGASRNPAGCEGHGVLKYGFTYSSDLRLWDEPTSYVPASGPWVSLGVSLTTSDTTRSVGTQAGGWNIGLSGYVTTVVTTQTTQYSSTPERVGNAIQVVLPQGGFETYVSGSACSATAGVRCEFTKDPISQARVKRAGGDASVLGGYPAAVRALLRDARGFTRALPDGSYEVYGGSEESIRAVAGGYEAWLSARVDRSGLALIWNYETRPSGLKRVRSLTDATGLETRLYYPDSDPRFAGVADLSELVSANPGIESLVTSVVDPYGRVAQFRYQDVWSGWVLGEPLSPKLAPALRSALREQSRVFRLIESQDVLGVQSQIRYACGAASLPQTLDQLREGRRDGERAITPECVTVSAGLPTPGARWLDPQETQTPYGTTRYKRVDVASDSQHRSGWLVMNPVGQIEWKETVFGVQSEALHTQMAALVGHGPGSRPAHIPSRAWATLLSAPSLDYRTSYQWSFKALESYSIDGRVFDPASEVPAMPPLSLAHIVQYAHDHTPGGAAATMGPVKVWEKQPGMSEGVYYGYEQAVSPDTFREEGSAPAHSRPSVMARRLDDGTMQATYTQYNSQGNPTLTVDALGRAQQIEYAANGIDATSVHVARWVVTEGVGTATRLERMARMDYNERGQVTREEGSLPGVGTTLDYEPSAPYRLAGVTTELGLRTRYEWSRIGSDPLTRTDRLTVTQPNGLVSISEYQQGWLIRESAEGRVREYSGHDAFGRVGVVSVGGNVKVRYSYNPSNRLDLQTIHNEVDGSEVKVTTDTLGRPEWTWQVTSAGEIASTSYRSYDASGNVASLWTSTGTSTDVVSWYYDIQGRPIQRWDTDGTQSQLVYSEVTGRLQASLDANGHWSYYQYDATGALLSKRMNDPSLGRETVRMEYDPMYGRVNRKWDAIGMTQYHYTANQPYRLEWMEEPLAVAGTATRTRMTPSYDNLNRNTGWGVTDDINPIPQSRMTMGYDDSAAGMGRVRRYENEVFAVTPNYDPVDGRQYGELNHLSYEMPELRTIALVQTLSRTDTAHDRRVNRVGYQLASGETVDSQVMYDAQGRVSQVDGLINAAHRTYAYDERGQLRHASRWDAGMSHLGTKGYQYDQIGNRIQIDTEDQYQNPISTDRTMTYGLSNRLESIQGTSIEMARHDRAGNLTYNPSNGQSYTWDEENRLVRIDYPTKNAQPNDKSRNYTRFTYDSEGRIKRVEEVEEGNRTEDVSYVWLGAQLIQKRDTATQEIKQTYNADGYTDYHPDGTKTKYLLIKDYLGSVTGKVSADGQLQERIDYDAWGEPESRQVRDAAGNMVTASRTASDIPFGYAGYWKHHRSKLSITQYRFYDPKLGRWLSKDPIAEIAGPNRYAYVGNSPSNWIDPSGLIPDAACKQQLRNLIERVRTNNQYANEQQRIWEKEVKEQLSKVGRSNLGEIARILTAAMEGFMFLRISTERANVSLEISAWIQNNSNCARELGLSDGATMDDLEAALAQAERPGANASDQAQTGDTVERSTIPDWVRYMGDGDVYDSSGAATPLAPIAAGAAISAGAFIWELVETAGAVAIPILVWLKG